VLRRALGELETKLVTGEERVDLTRSRELPICGMQREAQESKGVMDSSIPQFREAGKRNHYKYHHQRKKN